MQTAITWRILSEYLSIAMTSLYWPVDFTDRPCDMEKTRTCFKPGLGCWVVVWVVVATISLVLSYAIARSNGHISFFVPAISDTTSKNPEGAVFAQLFNTTALITLILIAIRYFQVKMINRQVDGGESSHLSQLNSLSIVFGIGGALGASLVANFKSVEVSFQNQVCFSYYIVHVIIARVHSIQDFHKNFESLRIDFLSSESHLIWR